VHLSQNVPFVLACLQVSAPPRLENPDSDEKDALFGLDTQITTYIYSKILAKHIGAGTASEYVFTEKSYSYSTENK
jgi:hypothetical protein